MRGCLAPAFEHENSRALDIAQITKIYSRIFTGNPTLTQ